MVMAPLINPSSLTMDYFGTTDVQGFGVLQRDAHFSNYGDLGAHYNRRPQHLGKTENNWGPGDVVLVQLPTPERDQ